MVPKQISIGALYNRDDCARRRGPGPRYLLGDRPGPA